MYWGVSSKLSMSSNSFGNSVLMSLTERIRSAGVGAGAGAGAVAGDGTPLAFSDFEMSAKSCAISFKTTRSWSILCKTSSTDGFFSLITQPTQTIICAQLPLLFCPSTSQNAKIT